MKYGNATIDYSLQNGMLDLVESDDYAEGSKPQYARQQAPRAMRKRPRSNKRRSGPAHPGCGMGARRNRHYSW